MQVHMVDPIGQPWEGSDILGLLGEGEVARAPLLQSLERSSLECHRPSTRESASLLQCLGPKYFHRSCNSWRNMTMQWHIVHR